MSISPIITFKAGRCDLNEQTKKVKPLPTPGYIYLYAEDDLMHFCWRPRGMPMTEPELDLLMVPSDCTFTTLEPTSAEKPANPKKPTNGRIYVLKFSSSSQRELFWLQSKSQHPNGDTSFFSSRDLKLGQIVNTLLSGEDIDVQAEIANLPADQNGDDGDDDDDPMEDIEGQNHETGHHRGGSGGAGPGATGGDFRDEGEQARGDGADGGRAAAPGGMDASSIIQNFINSMPGGKDQQGAQQPDRLFTTLADLLIPASTFPLIDTADAEVVDGFLQYLPPTLVALAQEADDAATTQIAIDVGASKQAPSLEQKKDILRRVLRSPQFSQSLSSLTIALRDGGLPSISEALNIPVRNGGYMRRGGMPLGGGDAVEAFLDGVRDQAEKRSKPESSMETD